MGEANNGKKSQKLAKILGTASATHLEAFLMPVSSLGNDQRRTLND
jgi:hypothetical protein